MWAPHPRPLSPREEGSVSLHGASRGPLTPGPSPQGKRGASACIGPHGGPSPPAPLPKAKGRRREGGQVSVHQASPPMRQRREAAVVGSASALGWTLQALRHEFLALVAFQGLVAGLLVAGFHLLLLAHLGGRQALGHEFLALVALQRLVAGLLVARGHLLLLRRLGLFLGREDAQRRGQQRRDQDSIEHRFLPSWLQTRLQHALSTLALPI